MYLDFETYRDMGGKLDAERFAEAEPFAEDIINMWTLGRMRDGISWDRWRPEVNRCMLLLVDSAEAIREGDSGRDLTSYSNGQDSFGFEAGQGNAAMEAARQACLRILPVQLVSACVGYNHAR